MENETNDPAELKSIDSEKKSGGVGKRKGGGAQLNRSETVTVRLDPKLRYLAELASRKQRRTLSSFIEWAIEESLSRVNLRETSNPSFDMHVAEEAPNLWDVDEPDRFVKLALRHSDLLTHEEQILWKLIRENGLLWRGNFKSGEWGWKVVEDSMIFDRLREYWGLFKDIASGDKPRSALPKWQEKPVPKNKSSSTPFNDMDDDIPF